MPKRTNSKNIILDAVEAVIMDKGITHLSLDSVARKAGVSKGGLMYNFPTKDALLTALVERMVAEYYRDMQTAMAALPESKGRHYKASVRLAFNVDEKKQKLGLALLAAMSYNSKLLDPLKAAYQADLKKLFKSGPCPGRAAVVSLACDGLMFRKILGLAPLSRTQKEKVKNEMLKIITDLENHCK
jgi:AcrR family transcriptional regulator